MDGWFDGVPVRYDCSSQGNRLDDTLLSADVDVVVGCRLAGIGRTVPLSITFVQSTVCSGLKASADNVHPNNSVLFTSDALRLASNRSDELRSIEYSQGIRAEQIVNKRLEPA